MKNRKTNSKNNWEGIFSSKNQDEVSWYEIVPKNSINYLNELIIGKDEPVIDVGCGDSHFVDYLVQEGYQNIYALDISATALQKVKNRLGNDAKKVTWIVCDILDFKPNTTFSFWHDRASFHFQVKQQNIQHYTQLVSNLIKENGFMVVGTFAETGPVKCSGLDIKQYSQNELSEQFSSAFEKVKCTTEHHQTPFNTIQDFTFCSFKKIK